MSRKQNVARKIFSLVCITVREKVKNHMVNPVDRTNESKLLSTLPFLDLFLTCFQRDESVNQA